MWGGCLTGKARLSKCGEAICRVWGGCLEHVGRLSVGCLEAVWHVRLSGRYGEAVWM